MFIGVSMRRVWEFKNKTIKIFFKDGHMQ